MDRNIFLLGQRPLKNFGCLLTTILIKQVHALTLKNFNILTQEKQTKIDELTYNDEIKMLMVLLLLT
jgi:hypothetical protein